MGLFDPSITNVTSTSEGSSSSKTKSKNKQTPYQQEYFKNLLGQAQNLYQNYGAPEHYGGATVAGMTPAQMESMNQASNWITGGAQDQMARQMGNYNQMMSGRVNTGEGSPYGDMAAAYTQQATDSAKQMMGNVRGGQVMSGQSGGSSRGDMLNNQVITDTNQQLTNNLSNMYGNAYNQAQQTQMGALGQYGTMMNMPLNMSNALYNQVGLPQQQLNQNIMNDAKSRYDFNSMRPYRALEMYRNMIQGNMGGTQTGKSSTSGSSSSTSTNPIQGPSMMDKIGQVAGIAGTIMGIPGIG